MRYLSTLSVALIVLMALACTATPAQKLQPIQPSTTTIFQDVAIRLVKEHLGMKPLKDVTCLAWMQHKNPGRPFSATNAIGLNARSKGVNMRAGEKQVPLKPGFEYPSDRW